MREAMDQVAKESAMPAAVALTDAQLNRPKWRNKVGMEFVLIPAGRFQMGTKTAPTRVHKGAIHPIPRKIGENAPSISLRQSGVGDWY